MATHVSKLADVHPSAQLGDGVTVGPFCVIGPNVVVGDGCELQSHVVLTGHTTLGERNLLHPQTVIGGTPQDKSWDDDAVTFVEIGDDNELREGVTVHRGAEKEDGVTRIGNRNLLMANSHVAHNCHVHNDTTIVNGVLLGGHAHVQDKAVISGNSAVHHFCTVGTLAMVGGCSRVTVDVPPYMMSVGADQAEVRTINVVGLKRAGVSRESMSLVKQAYKLLFRQHKTLEATRNQIVSQLGDVLPIEVMNLFRFIEAQAEGRMGRQREAFRSEPYVPAKRAA